MMLRSDDVPRSHAHRSRTHRSHNHRSHTHPVLGGAFAGLALMALAACGSGDAGGVEAGTGAHAEGSGSQQAAVTGDVVIYAAASLTDTFSELGEQFEAAHEDVSLTFNFGGSSSLAQQILSGAPADVFAAASPTTMAQVTDESLHIGEPVVFAQNALQIAVPAGNPADVHDLTAFTQEELIIALCAEEVPCGAASVKVFEAAGLMPAPDTYEEDVRAALAKVRLDEVDAALVYKTDVIVAGDEVDGIDFPESQEAINDYPIVLLEEAPNPDGGRDFIDFVLSETGRSILGDAGFTLP